VPNRNHVGDAMNHTEDFSRFKQFAELCQRLAETSSKLQKRAQMAEFLRLLPPPDAGLAALYLAGSPFPETDGSSMSAALP
jgi:DNA ligase 1